MKIREITVNGYEVELHDFGYAQYLYPAFNGNAEFEVTRKGFRKLSSYLRFINFVDSIK